MPSRDRWLAGLVVGAGLAAGVAWFYRDPDRQPPDDPDLCLAPADGRIVAVTNAVRGDRDGRCGGSETHSGLPRLGADAAGAGHEIVIFLSLWDVHVQRSPVAGTVVTSRYIRGPRWPAMLRRAAGNGGHLLEIETDRGRVAVRRSAGLIAGRVTTRVSVGDQLAVGQRIGRIHLGSRTAIRLPDGFRVAVRPGDRVRAGETPIGQWSSSG